jgi:hypothetical protein
MKKLIILFLLCSIKLNAQKSPASVISGHLHFSDYSIIANYAKGCIIIESADGTIKRAYDGDRPYNASNNMAVPDLNNIFPVGSSVYVIKTTKLTGSIINEHLHFDNPSMCSSFSSGTICIEYVDGSNIHIYTGSRNYNSVGNMNIPNIQNEFDVSRQILIYRKINVGLSKIQGYVRGDDHIHLNGNCAPFSKGDIYIEDINTGNQKVYKGDRNYNDIGNMYITGVSQDFGTGALIQITSLNSSLITENGNLGVGTSCPQAKFDVAGTIRADEVKVDLTRGCDFVFDKDYKLLSIDELARFIEQNKHLPDIAPAKEMESNGINLSEMNAKLLQKIEEQSLYIIEMNERLTELEKQIKK